MENMSLKERKWAADLDNLSKQDIQVTYEAKAGKIRK